MKMSCNNDEIKAALKDYKSIIDSLPNTYDFDDNELTLLNKFKSLPQLDRDILFLISQYPVSKVADMYAVSRQYIYRLKNKIYDKLNTNTPND